MLKNSTLPHSPLYDPKSKILNFRFEEDFKNISYNLLGSGLLYEDPHFFYKLEDNQQWLRPKEICRRPIFINGKPDRFDALQGKIGDCWFVIGLEAITFNEQLITHVVPPDQSFDDNYIGVFHFRIWKLGNWYDVVVDDRLPVWKKTKKLCYAHSKRGDIFWAALLEKAFAKFCSTTTFSYDNVKGGYAMTSLQCLSGGIVEKIFTSNLNDKTLKWLMQEVFSKHALMSTESLKSDKGILEQHGYAVTKVFKCEDDDPDYPGFFFVRILNPWGFKEWEGEWSDYDEDHWGRFDQEIRKKLGQKLYENDGEFWIKENDFLKYFNQICICHLGPGQYIESCHKVDFKLWKTTIFYGEWVKQFSAGGSSVSIRHKNPQYVMLINWPKDQAQCFSRCNVVIELSSWSKYGRKDGPGIAFYVYSLTDKDNLPTPLDKQFFENNNPVNKPPKFSMSDGRASLLALTLDAGKYCIVPCTRHENEESQFLLRVFSESCEDIWEYDNKISKSLPSQEQSLNEFDKELQSMFDDVAQGQDEIDWIGLKEILEKAMSSNRSYFDLIASFFKSIREVFHILLSIRSSNDYESGDIVFSKDECRSMIAMLDDNHSGKLSFSELINLWNKISFWIKVYEQHRDETEGYLTVAQLRDALSSIGYNLNKRTVHSLSYVYANDEGNIFLTDFILCGVTIETVLSLCDKEHLESGHKITFTMEEWVKHTLIL